MQNRLLRQLPKMEVLLAHEALSDVEAACGHRPALLAARTLLAEYREGILSGRVDDVPDMDALAREAATLAMREATPSLRRVINATGVVLHTNLGRAPLAEAAVQAVTEVARGYSTLEYDTESGERGSRHVHIEDLLVELTGAEAAMVVNNNAAAVLLALSAMSQGKEAVVSRGELVEIGGSFRVPAIMALSGAILREVGTTNRTHPADYEEAVGPETGILFKAHTSNYRVVGFTSEVTLGELSAIGRRHGLPVLYDMGGGCMLPSVADMVGEPSVAACVRDGADVICFSGDKLLGGPQAGILLGRVEYIARMKKHPLARAIRVDKMTLAALEATLRLYLDPAKATAEIPVLRMANDSPETLEAKAARLAARLSFLGERAEVVMEPGALGGGTTPGYAPVSAAVAISGAGLSRLEAGLRHGSLPVVARIAKERLLLDVRTIDEADFDIIASHLKAAVEEESGR